MACIRAVQIATPSSRERLGYARVAWEGMTVGQRAEAEAGREAALERVYQANRGLVVECARRWRGVESDVIDRADIEGAAGEGYIKSLLTFDLERGLEHSTHAMRCMQNAILRMVYEMQPWAQSANVTRAQQRIASFVDAYRRDHRGKTPSMDEIAAGTELDRRTIRFAQRIPAVVSGDGLDDDDQPFDHIPSDEGAGQQAAEVREILVARYGQEQALALEQHADSPVFAALIRAAHDEAL